MHSVKHFELDVDGNTYDSLDIFQSRKWLNLVVTSAKGEEVGLCKYSNTLPPICLGLVV